MTARSTAGILVAMEPTWLALINPQTHICWRGRWRPGTTEPSRILCDHELVVVESGACTVTVAGVDHRLTAGEWLIVPPGQDHATRASGRAACLRTCVHFDWAPDARPVPVSWYTWLPQRPAAPTIRRAPAFVPPGILHGTTHSAGFAVGQRLRLAWQTGDRRAVRLLTLELLLFLLQLQPPQRSAVPDAQADLALRLQDLLHDLAQEPTHRPLREACADLGVRYEHLCRSFSRQFGVAPLRYLQLARIERAKHLLDADATPVQVIAAACGFQDPGAFAVLFRRIVGSSPTVWRNRHRISRG